MERQHLLIDTTGPKRDDQGRIVYRHATEIPYPTGAMLWQQRINELKILGADSSYQVVVIPTNNLTKNISRSKEHPFSGKNPVAVARIKSFPDNEDLVGIESEVPGVKHAIIVSSPQNYVDLFHIMQAASHYKESLGTEHITLFAPFLATTRQDKNCDSKTGEYKPVSINVHATIAALSTYIDSFMVIEPHSFATQTAAAEIGKPLLPITPWKYLMDIVLGKEISIKGKSVVLTRDNTVAVRPDKGRNIAASRMSNNYGLEHVSFDKKRLSPTETELSLSLEDQQTVKGKICAVYDDEFNTNETLGGIAVRLEEYGALGLIAVGVHGKFTGNWQDHVENPEIKKIFVTDSRQPIGNIEPYINSGKIETVSLQGLIYQILEADAKGINFWTDPNFSHMVLQTNGQDENC